MPPRRKPGSRAPPRASRRSAPTRVIEDDDDDVSDLQEEPLQPQPPNEATSADEEEDAGENDGLANEDEDEEEEDGTPAASSQRGTPRPSSSRTRKGGRAGKHVRGTRPSDWGTPEPLGDEASDAGTPRGYGFRGRARARGRGGSRGGFRGRARGNRGPAQQTRPPVDEEGNERDVANDEVILPEDPEGEEKINKDGHLQGGREYRVRTFKIIGRGDRLYMLSTEPARCTGFRDSYLFFAKHPHLWKIVIDEDQKKDLIDRDIIPHSYKGRSIGVVTAHSVFREFGCKIIVGGKKVTDDYKVAEAKARGDKEGELADPTDAVPPPGRGYNRNQYVAWHGATSKAYSNDHFERLPMTDKAGATGKRKSNLTTGNWMLEHARAASTFNTILADARKHTHGGVYNTHLNMMCFPASMQPTHARWERQPTPPPENPLKRKLAALKAETPTVNGDTSMLNGERVPSHDEAKPTDSDADSDMSPSSKLFPPPSNVLARNFLIVDTHLETPHASTIPPPASRHWDPNAITNTPQGAPQLSEAEMEIMDLPEECRQALREAKQEEEKWTRRWGREAAFGWRGEMRIGVGMGL